MRSTSLLLAAACLAVPTAIASAQAPALVPGAHLRVTAPRHGAERHPATLVAVRADSLVVRIARFDSLALPLSAITRLEVGRGARRQVLKGLGRGFLIGAAAGIVIGAAGRPDGFIVRTRADGALWGGAMLGTVGALVGTAYGAIPQQRWERVDVGRLQPRVGVAPSGRGLALSASAWF